RDDGPAAGVARDLVLAGLEVARRTAEQRRGHECRAASDHLRLEQTVRDAEQALVRRNADHEWPLAHGRRRCQAEPAEARRGQHEQGEEPAQAHDSSTLPRAPGPDRIGGARTVWYTVWPGVTPFILPRRSACRSCSSPLVTTGARPRTATARSRSTRSSRASRSPSASLTVAHCFRRSTALPRPGSRSRTFCTSSRTCRACRKTPST